MTIPEPVTIIVKLKISRYCTFKHFNTYNNRGKIRKCAKKSAKVYKSESEERSRTSRQQKCPL
jgi:hypothetical protein